MSQKNWEAWEALEVQHCCGTKIKVFALALEVLGLYHLRK